MGEQIRIIDDRIEVLEVAAQGPRGPRGFRGLTPRGAYDGATEYAVADSVSHEGSSWVAIQATVGNAPPSLPTTSNDYWEIVAEKGSQGIQGIQGDKGDAGAAGEPLTANIQEADGIVPGVYPITRFYHGGASFGHIYVEMLVGTGEAILYIHHNGDPVYGPIVLDDSAPIDEDDLDLTLAEGDTVDLVISGADATALYILAQIDGSA